MPLIRAGVATDLDEIRAIQAASPEAAQWDPREYLQYDLRVLIESEHVAGFVVSRFATPDEAELLNLAVAPEYRRRGAGRRLVHALLQAFQTASPTRVFLEVRSANQAARSFYKSLGFKEIGIRENYYDSPPDSAIVMKFHSC
jgi:ribosomal-protein-alanine N-acetyltransferase